MSYKMKKKTTKYTFFIIVIIMFALKMHNLTNQSVPGYFQVVV